jgi:integrase
VLVLALLPAQVWSPADKKTIRKTFPTVAEANIWRQESQVALRAGTLRASTQVTLRQAAADWLLAAERGIARTRSGDAYKPSAIRSYRQGLNKYILPRLGPQRLDSITTTTLQDLADELVGQGLSPSTVRNALMPLRPLYRRAQARELVTTNPTRKLVLPAVRGRRDRIARPDEATALINALPHSERGLWATALYAGLRLGELQALDWTHIDLDNNLIHIERSWDRIAGFIDPKSRAGTRRVPITNTLRTHLINHKLQQGSGQRLLFPNSRGDRPFNPSTIRQRSLSAWRDTKLEPITLHECRHTCAAFMIAAGINTKALSTYMGHSSITITLDRYGHLLPGNEQQAATLLDRWLQQATAN